MDEVQEERRGETKNVTDLYTLYCFFVGRNENESERRNECDSVDER